MAPLTNGQNGRDEHGRFTAGNQAAVGRSRPFAAQVASLRRAFFEEATAEDLAKLCRMLIQKGLAGDLVAARWALLFLIGKPSDAVWPDAMAAREAAEAQADQAPPPRPAARKAWLDPDLHRTLERLTDPEARLDAAARALAAEIRTLRGAITAPGAAAEPALGRFDPPR
jgi:hypothetical protein